MTETAKKTAIIVATGNVGKTIVLATRNPGKTAEMRDLLIGLDIDLLTAEDVDVPLPEVIEDALTLEGNARKKAEAVLGATGLPALADDTGLEVHSLDGRPGVHSARFAGSDCDPARNRRKLLEQLADAADRTARFRTVIVLAHPGGIEFFDGVCEGAITDCERGHGGFGYDAIFVPDGDTRTFAEMTPEEKNRISHRGRALQKLRLYLETGGPE